MNLAARAGNAAAAYDDRRRGKGVDLDPLPTTAYRLMTTHMAIEWCWAQQPELPRALLDICAGGGFAGEYAMREVRDGHLPPIQYAATEQSIAQVAQIHLRVPGSSATVWRYEPDGPSLRATLEAADALFLPAYPAVLVAQALEHIEDEYGFLDQVWEMVRPGGFLVLNVPRNDPHRLHFRQYTWNELAAVCSHYAGWDNPLIIWERDYWTDLLIAVRKPEPAEPGEAP